jgi:hypothetical protein
MRAVNFPLKIVDLQSMNQVILKSMLERLIESETMNLQIYTALGDGDECLKIKHRIADAEILLLRLSGDLPS